MKKIFMTADSIVETGQNCSMVDRSMVGKYVHNYLYAIFICAVAHSLEIGTVAQHIVAYSPVGRLIIIVPLTLHAVAGLTEERHTAAVAHETCLHGRGLHVVIACVGYCLHIRGNSVERPRPCVQYHFIILITMLLCHRPANCGQRKSACDNAGNK